LEKSNKNIFYKIRISLLLLGGLLAFYWLYFYFLGFSLDGIDRANALKQELPELITQKQYNESIKKNFYLLYLDSSQKDDNYWNLASSYYLLAQKKQAKYFYDSLLKSPSLSYQAKAWHQLGNLFYLESADSLDKALEAYKNSFYINENNIALRYNYELLKKLNQKNQPQKTNQSQKKENKNQNNNTSKTDLPKAEEPQNDFLEAISNQEQEQIKKYQLKRSKSVKKDKNLPDW
jgi:hypothetical protein